MGSMLSESWSLHFIDKTGNNCRCTILFMPVKHQTYILVCSILTTLSKPASIWMYQSTISITFSQADRKCAGFIIWHCVWKDCSNPLIIFFFLFVFNTILHMSAQKHNLLKSVVNTMEGLCGRQYVNYKAQSVCTNHSSFW